MEQLLLINPSPRKGKGRKMATRRRKHRSAAQRAATKRLVAMNRARRGSHTKRRTRRRHTAMASNPAPRRHSRRRVHHRAKRHSYRRNPSPRMSGLMGLLKPAFQQAVGALGADVVLGYVPLPLAIKVSPARHAIKGLVGLATGVFFKGSVGRNVALGILTVAMHDAAKESVQTMMPDVRLGAEPTVEDLQGIGFYNAAPIANNTGMGEYVQSDTLGLFQPDY